MADYLRIYLELSGYLNHFKRGCFVGINFHPVAHIENLIHFLPICAGAFLYQAKKKGGVANKLSLTI